MLDLRIIETTAFNNMLNQFSRTYQGSPETIIKNICKDNIGQEVSLPEIKSAQTAIKVCVPYMNAYQACNWILSRMSTPEGLPYFLFKTIKSDKIQLKSLEEMITQDPWNGKTPYVYSIANAQAQQQNSGTIDSISLFNVEKFSNDGNTGILHKMLDGVIGSQHAVTDMGSGQTETFQYNANDTFNRIGHNFKERKTNVSYCIRI